jgi:hypothetical protein
MSAWKLVEAVAEESPVDSTPKENASADQNNRNNGGRFNNCNRLTSLFFCIVH